MLERAHVAFEKTDAEENADLVSQFGVKQAPTLVVVEDGHVDTYANLSDIRKFVENIQA